MLPILHLPQSGPDSLKEPRQGFARFYIVIIKVKSLHLAPTFGCCVFFDLFLASLRARDFYEKKYKIEEYGMGFVSSQKLERTYTFLFSH